MAAAEEQWISLFPLNTVLFPDGVLPLRVFETRYVDMVRACMKTEAPFGVVAIKSGTEVGVPAEPHAVGTLATITQWDMPEFGVLLIQTRGGARFNILDMRRQPNDLLEGRIELIAPDPVVDGGETLALCSSVLRVVIEDLQQRAADSEGGPDFISPFAAPFKLDDTGWVANRWCEMLPITLDIKQQMLTLQDPATRLKTVQAYLRENGVV